MGRLCLEFLAANKHSAIATNTLFRTPRCIQFQQIDGNLCLLKIRFYAWPFFS